MILKFDYREKKNPLSAVLTLKCGRISSSNDGIGAGIRHIRIRSLEKRKVYEIVRYLFVTYYIKILNFNFSIQSFDHIGIILIVNKENTGFSTSFDIILKE
jgi:hypothetical protein